MLLALLRASASARPRARGYRAINMAVNLNLNLPPLGATEELTCTWLHSGFCAAREDKHYVQFYFSNNFKLLYRFL